MDYLNIFWILIGLSYCTVFIFISLQSNYFALCLLICVVTFGNFVVEYTFVPDQLNWLTELTILLLLFKSIIEKKTRFTESYHIFFPYILLLFFLLTFGSSILNNSRPLETILCLRLIFRYVILFIALINLHLEDKELLKLNKLVFALVLVQVPVAVVKYFSYGKGEMAVGTYAGIHGGALSTELPLAVIPFAIGYYLHYKKSLIYFSIATAFVCYSVIGGKRAFIFYFIPLLLYLSLVFRHQLISSIRLKELLLGAIFILVAFVLPTRYIPTLNPEKIAERFKDPRKTGYGAVLEYAYIYNIKSDEESIPQGRISSTIKVLELINNGGISTWVFGYGPGTMMESRFINVSSNSYNHIIAYGKTLFNWTAYQFGIIATILLFLIPFKLLLFTKRVYHRFGEDYWKAFFLGLNCFCFSFILIGMTYSLNLLGDFLPCIFFYLAAVAVKKVRKLQSSVNAKPLRTENTLDTTTLAGREAI